MPFFQSATDFQINGGSFQDTHNRHNTSNYHEAINIHGNNNLSPNGICGDNNLSPDGINGNNNRSPNYSTADSRRYDSLGINMQGYPSFGQGGAANPQRASPEQLSQLQILQLQYPNLQPWQLAAIAAASPPGHTLSSNTNSPQLSGRPYDTYGNVEKFPNGGLNPCAPPNYQSTWLPQPQPPNNSPQLFLPQTPVQSPPPSIPPSPLLQSPPQSASVFQQRLSGHEPEAFLGSPQQTLSPYHALPGSGVIGGTEQQFERPAQQAPVAPAQPPVSQSPSPAGIIPPMSPSIAIHPPPPSPQGLPHGSDLVQTSPAGVIPPMSAPIGGVSPGTITPPAVRSTTAPPGFCDFTGGGAGPVSPTTNPQTPATNAVSAQATLTPENDAVPQHQAIPIVAPQPLTPQTVNTGCSILVDQVIDAAPPSTTTPTVVDAAATDSQLPPAGPSNIQTLPPLTMAAPSTPEKLNMAPIPVLITSPVGAPSHSAISAVIMSPLLSPPIRPQSAPQIKRKRSWLGRKFSSKTSKVQ